jgi:hypothetical protein
MIIATVENQGQTFYLKGTTWTFRVERADQFETLEAAKAAAVKAVKAARFMTKTLAKKIQFGEA